LESLRKEAFDPNDEDVVLIDPGDAAINRYKDIMLPCDRESRINNSLTAPSRVGLLTADPTSVLQTSMSKEESSRVFNQKLK